MARTEVGEVKLPWRRTAKGAMAELGAVFRVELIGGDWQCSVKSGRCHEVIATGLRKQADGKRLAQAHAAEMPEVLEAAGLGEMPKAASKRRAKKPAKSKRRAKKTPTARSRGDAEQPAETPPDPAPAAAPAPTKPAESASTITFQRTDDGCLCGKTQGVCWVANAGEVVFARPLPQAVMNEIRDAVARHYAAQGAASEASEAKPPAETPPRAARSGKKLAARTRQPRPTAKKTAAKSAKEPAPAKERKVRKAGRARASKPKAAKGKRDEAKEDAPVKPKQETKQTKPAAAKRASKTEASPPATGPAAAAPSTPPGPLAWSEIDGKPRGVAAHGTFLIEPEGQGFGLYFADAGGQTRHLRSGAVPELRRAAEELAVRGEPVMREAPSREQDEALMRVFASGAVEGA